MQSVTDLQLRCSLVFNLFVLQLFVGENFNVGHFASDTGVPAARVAKALHQLKSRRVVQRLQGWPWSLHPTHSFVLSLVISTNWSPDAPEQLADWNWYECRDCGLILASPRDFQYFHHKLQKCPQPLKIGRWARFSQSLPKIPQLN